jgi:membrane-bound inhibitor of C-type lysozyme
MTRFLTSLMLAVALLSGCSDPAPEQPPQSPATPTIPEPAAPTGDRSEASTAEEAEIQTREYGFRCDDGSEFGLTVTGHNAVMTLEDTTYEMRQQPAASGVFHAGDLWQVHSRGDTALLIGQDSTRECQQVASRIIPTHIDTTPVSQAGPISGETVE